MKVVIVTNKQNSGKTSYFARYVVNNKVNGIISLSDSNKTFYSATRISDGESKVIMDVNYPKSHRIGKFGIDTKAFKWANDYLIDLVDKNEKIIALDECGQLELYKRGYYPFLEYSKKNFKNTLVLTIRDEFVDSFKEYFSECEIEIIKLL